jgi:hypothetical protein
MADNFILDRLGFTTSKSAEKDESPQLQAIDARLDADRERRNKQGLLARGVNSVLEIFSHSDVDSEKKLERLRQEVVDAQAHNDVQAIKKLDAEIGTAVKADEQAAAATSFRDGVSNFVTDTAITSTYFVRGARGRTAATVLTGLNDIHLEDGTVGMVGEGLLGATRGYVLARTFETLGKSNLSAANKGMAIGLAGRLEDGLLNAQSYKDQNGQFHLSTGLEATASSVANPYALLADAATFGVANGAGRLLDKSLAGALTKSPIAANVFAGFTIGTISGANNEIQNESKTGNYSALNIIEQSLLGGASNATSAALGAKLEQTGAFAPGPSLFRPGTRPEGSIILPHPETSPERTGKVPEIMRPGDTAGADEPATGTPKSHPYGQENPIPPISKMVHLEPETPGSLPVELFEYKPEVKIDNGVVARYPDYDAVEKAGYTWFDNKVHTQADGKESYFYVRTDSPEVFAVVPEEHDFSVHKVDGLTAMNSAEFTRQKANLERLRQWHSEPPVDASETERKPNGRTEYLGANFSFESKNLDESAARIFSGARLERFNNLRGDFEEEALRRNVAKDSIALLYKQLNRLLADDPSAHLPIEQRRDLAEQILKHAAYPETVEQAKNNTCTVANVEKRTYYRQPDKNAQVLADIALTGRTVTVGGNVIDLTQIENGTRPDTSANKSLELQRVDSKDPIRDDPGRDLASQILQTTMVNDYWHINTAYVLDGQFIVYENFAFDSQKRFLGIIRDTAKVNQANLTEPGATDIYWNNGSLRGTVAVSEITPLYEQNGRRVTGNLNPQATYYDAQGKPRWTATKPGEIKYEKQIDKGGETERLKYLNPAGNWQVLRNGRGQYLVDPQIRFDWLHQLSNDFTNSNEGPFVISNHAREGVLGVKDPGQLALQIERLRNNQQMPAIAVVNPTHPLFVDNIPTDQLHVVMINDAFHGLYDRSTAGISPDQMRILFSNQWGSAHNYLNPGLKLPFFFDSMQYSMRY